MTSSTKNFASTILFLLLCCCLYSISYAQCDGNQPPIANPNTRTTNEDNSITVSTSGTTNPNNLLRNDTDPENGALTITGYTVAGQAGTPVIGSPFTVTGTLPNGSTGTIGTLTINANGSYALSLTGSDFNGAFPTITYTIKDPCDATSSSTLDIAIAPVEDCPDLDTYTMSTPEDNPLSLASGPNKWGIRDVDGPNGTGYTITIQLTNPNNVANAGFFTATSTGGVTVSGSGTLFLSLQGNFTDLNNYFANSATAPVYTPPVDYNTQVCGTLGQFRTTIYQVGTNSPAPDPANPNQRCDMQLRGFGIISAADALNYAVNACQNAAKSFNVLQGTGTVSGTPNNFEVNTATPPQTVTVTAINGAAISNPITLANGQLTVSANGDITFTPNTGFTGTQTFTYTAQPGTGCAETRNVTITVSAPPVITGTTSVNVGQTTQLTGSGTPAATNPWISSDPAVATISNTGLVTGVSSGTVTITYTNSNGCMATATVTVTGSSICYKPAAMSGAVLDTNVGISSLRPENTDGWPQVRKGAWIAMESKTKGFVVNRIPTTAGVNAIAAPIEGMMVYDEQADCLKIYTSTDNGVSFGWHCFNTQACPD